MRKLIFWIDYHVILPITRKCGAEEEFMAFLKMMYPEQFQKELEYEREKELARSKENEGNIKCPNCGGTEWYEGPSGGLSVNIECTKCGDRFNYTFDSLDPIGKGKIIAE